jgi:hypothetical protein
MKKIVIILIFMALGNYVKADQLEWISKTDAQNAAELIRNTDFVFLYCGCCDNSPVRKAFVTNVDIIYTGFENYYSLLLYYTDEDGQAHSETLDLAYVWMYFEMEKYTVGQLLGLEHDPCSSGDF